MFQGLSAFPLTPLTDGRVDESAFIGLLERLVAAEVDSICVLGSTGNYAFLDAGQRATVARLAVTQAGNCPVVVGVGALTTSGVLSHIEAAQRAGASGLLLPPMSYQPLHDDEVFALYETAAHASDIPICVYDNPTTTHFRFSNELHARIAALLHIRSIKIPAVSQDTTEARASVANLRARIPDTVTIGISGDAAAVRGLNAGCQAWYSVIGGLFAEPALAITRAACAGEAEQAAALSARLEPIWAFFRKHGSLRVVATLAEQLGLVSRPCLPRPLQSLDNAARSELDRICHVLELK